MSPYWSFLGKSGGIFRLITFFSFIPALPMCLAHGLFSKRSVLGFSLMPMFVSSISGMFFHRHEKKKEAEARQTATEDQDSSEESLVQEGIHEVDSVRGKLTHPFFVFAFDIFICIVLVIILIYTWRWTSRYSTLGMLAAYATIPLMISLVSHFLLAMAALWHGLSIHGLSKWVASRAVDSHCPKCEHPLRPGVPELPWVKLFKNTKNKVTGSAPMFTDGSASISEDADPDMSCMSRATEPASIVVRSKATQRSANLTQDASEVTSLLDNMQ